MEIQREVGWELGRLLCEGDDDVEVQACEGVEWLEVCEWAESEST